jgi:hypothetical protein
MGQLLLVVALLPQSDFPIDNTRAKEQNCSPLVILCAERGEAEQSSDLATDARA